MQLAATDVAELAAVLPLGIELESYRERLSPMALAVLQGASGRAIDRRRESVLDDVWDDPLRRAALEGIARLRAELQRKFVLLELAEEDVGRPAPASKLARPVVDRILAELLDHHDKNLDALEELERELEALPPGDRAARAGVAARGACLAARIPPNELRSAMVRAARAAEKNGLENEGAFERAVVLVAKSLATAERRAAAREWVRMLAEASAANVPLLAGELQGLVSESVESDAASDLIWIQACLGLTFEVGLALS